MGWDAYAIRPNGQRIKVLWGRTYRNPKLANTKYRKAFEGAADRVKRGAGSYDWLLPIGGLDVSTCGEELSRATGRSVYDENPWSVDFVRHLAEIANWPEESNSYVLSAREFLEACAECGLGVEFSW